MTRAIKTYTGGKAGAGTYQTIINEIPPILRYIEPMVGGGGVFYNLKRAKDLTVINDYDSSVIERYKQAELSGVVICSGHYKYAIEQHSSEDKNTLIYFDPPYLVETCKAKKHYYSEKWDTGSHIEFLDYARSRKELVIVSHYPCELYRDKLSDWRYIEYQSTTRNGVATEGLWLNFPKADTLHDSRYIGSNFTERQAIKRKVSRIVKKLKMLPKAQLDMILRDLSNSGAHSHF